MSGVDAPSQSHLARWLAIGAGVVVLALVLLLAFADPKGGARGSTQLVGQVAPPVVATDMNGRPFDLDDLRGRWVVVNFFATWCPPCVVEHPELVAFAEQGAASGEAAVVSIAFDDNARRVEEFFRDHGGEWPVITGDTGGFAIDYGVVAVPESYLVDPFGIVRAKFTGGVTADGISTTIAQLSGVSP